MSPSLRIPLFVVLEVLAVQADWAVQESTASLPRLVLSCVKVV